MESPEKGSKHFVHTILPKHTFKIDNIDNYSDDIQPINEASFKIILLLQTRMECVIKILWFG